MQNKLSAIIMIGILVILVLIIILAINRNKGNENQSDQNTAVKKVVYIKNFAFNPETLEINQGEEIIFINQDSVAHTATADDESFDSGLLTQGQEYKVRFDDTGTFPYHCIPHPSMKGQIIIK